MTVIRPSQLVPANYSYTRTSFSRFLEDMSAIGAEHIELYGAAPHLYIEDATLDGVTQIRKGLETRGIDVVCFTPEQVLYPINIAAREASVRERSLAYFYKAIDICTELGSPKLFVTSGWGYRDENQSEAWKRSAESLAKIVARGDQRGLTMVIETLQPMESQLINNVSSLKDMIDEVGSPALKPALDTVAMAVAGETPLDYFRVFGREVAHVHFIDGSPAGHQAWGEGNLPMEQYLDELGQMSYEGWLAFELMSFDYWSDPLSPIQRSFERITSALPPAAHHCR